MAIIIALSYFTILPLFFDGFFSMHDDTQVPRVFEMTKALQDGNFPVRWVDDLGYGYGYPIFNFYSPLPYYIGGFIDLLGSGSLAATKIMFGAGIVLSGITMYMLVRSFFGGLAAIVAASVYLYLPYHAVNIYVRGAVGEFFAYAFLPLVFLGLFKMVESNNVRWIAVYVAGLTGVILSHNLSAFMLVLFLIPLGAALVYFAKKKRNFLVRIGFATLLSLLLTAFYIIPAVLEMDHTNVRSQVGGGANFQDHFVCLPQLWNSTWGFGGSTPTCVDGMSFKLGKLNILLGAASLMLFLIVKRKKSENTLFVGSVFALFFVSIGMTLSWSQFIWEMVPSMEYLQYPWRFLNFAGLFLAIIIGWGIYAFSKLHKNGAILLSVLIIVVTIYFNAKLFTPQEFIARDDSVYTAPIYIKWFVSRISDEYMPQDFNKPKSTSQVPAEVFEISSGDVVMEENRTGYKRARIVQENNAQIHVNVAYFPDWRVRIDGEEMDFRIENNGLSLQVPEGEHTVEVVKTQSLVQKIGNALSIGGLVVLGATLFYSKRNFASPLF